MTNLKKNKEREYLLDTHENSQDHYWGDLVRNNVIQLSTLTVGLIMAAVVTFATIRLFPLIQRLDKLEITVSAHEQEDVKRLDEATRTRESVIRVEENISVMRTDLQEMRTDIKNLLQR